MPSAIAAATTRARKPRIDSRFRRLRPSVGITPDFFRPVSRRVYRHLVADHGVIVFGDAVVEMRSAHVLGVEADDEVEIAVTCGAASGPSSGRTCRCSDARCDGCGIRTDLPPSPSQTRHDRRWRSGCSRRSKRSRYGQDDVGDDLGVAQSDAHQRDDCREGGRVAVALGAASTAARQRSTGLPSRPLKVWSQWATRPCADEATGGRCFGPSRLQSGAKAAISAAARPAQQQAGHPGCCLRATGPASSRVARYRDACRTGPSGRWC